MDNGDDEERRDRFARREDRPAQREAKRRPGVVVRRPLDRLIPDVLADYGPRKYFAKITLCERERTGDMGRHKRNLRRAGQAIRWHLMMDCYSADWLTAMRFGKSHEMPRLTELADGSGRFHVIEVIMDEEWSARLLDMAYSSRAHIHRGNWILIGLLPDTPDSNGSSCIGWLPAPGSHDPMTIGLDANVITLRLVSVERIRPPSRLIELRRFADAYGAVSSAALD